MPHYQFNPDYPKPFSVIHPLKVKSVMELVKDALPEYIESVHLFGSSLDLTCAPYSDVDLYIISENEKEAYAFFYKRCKALKIKADILVGDRGCFQEEALDINSIEWHVAEQGVVIYEKEKSNIA